MSFGSIDSDFDRYRKNRIRHKNKVSAEGAAYENSALRELEQVEARELQDQQLTREVHEFFADATKQAATIVERMAHDAEAEADVKVETEMEAFLIDAFARMNGLVMTLIQKRKAGAGEEKLEPKVANLVGRMLDEFRWQGTADLMDKHIGQDPFATDLDDVRRELQSHGGDASAMDTDEGEAAAPIEEHLVAEVEDEGADAEPPARDDDMPAIEVVGDDDDASDMVAEPEPAAEPAPRPEAAGKPSASHAELERFKEALKTLVRQGTMTRDEARAAWGTRLRSLGLTS